MKETLSIEHVARIEGHGTITVKVDSGEVNEIRMDIIEASRFFESMIVGKRYDKAPLITSRICGICSANHTVTSIKAIEAAMGIEISERTKILRKLLVYGSYLQNHATHLYVLAAPDYVGQPSVFPLAATMPEVVARALALKQLGNDLCTLIGGRPVHPVAAVVGGFTSEPSSADLLLMATRLRAAIADAVATVELFASLGVPELETSGDMLALSSSDDYAIYEGEVAALEGGWRKDPATYRSFIEETVVGYSNAKHSTVDGRTFMTGALPRINLSWNALLPAALKAAKDAGFSAVSKNPFYNNLCQAIELVDAAERCAVMCEKLVDGSGSSLPVDFKICAGEGSAATEAPRGTLYQSIAVDDDGLVVSGDVITPTAQNLANLEADMRAFAPTIVDLPRDEFILRVEQLVRAYDPCLSCAVH